MNERKPDRHDRPTYVKGDSHHRSGGMGKWLWPLLLAVGALTALSLCSREEHKRERVIDEPTHQNEVIEKQDERNRTP